MGVHGLWELLSPVGHRVSNEHVRNKVLAVDLSIWLTQFVKAMRDAEGAQVRNAHLLGVFRRCIKLLFLSVRPVLVFDGATPALKRRTLASRRAQREKHAARLRRLAERMLVNQMRQRVVGTAIRKRGTSRPPLPSSAAQPNSTQDQVSGVDDPASRFEDQDRIALAVPNSGPRRTKPSRKRSRSPPKEDLPGDDGPAVSFEDEDRIEPVSQVTPRTPSGTQRMGSTHVDDELFAADLADEEEVLTRDRDREPISLPDDVYEIDDEAVVGLPPNLQSEVFKQIKLHQRAKHRERMMLKQGDPSEFSKTQIEGFLQFTALNRKISSVRNAINSKSGASQRIASDSGRQFVLEEHATMYPRAVDESDSEEDDTISARAGRKLSGKDAPVDILARIRANRDNSQRHSEVSREQVREKKRIEGESRSGVGWASRVLEGQGGLALGGKSALRASPGQESDESREPSELENESGNQSNQKQGKPSPNQSEGDEDDDIEWEDGACAGTAMELTVPTFDIAFAAKDSRHDGKEETLSQAAPKYRGQNDGGQGNPDGEPREDDAVEVADVLLDIDDVESSPDESPLDEVMPSVIPTLQGGKSDHSILDAKQRINIVDSKGDGDEDITGKSQLEAESALRKQGPDIEGQRNTKQEKVSPGGWTSSAMLQTGGERHEEKNVNFDQLPPGLDDIDIDEQPLSRSGIPGGIKRDMMPAEQRRSTVNTSQSNSLKQRKSEYEEDNDIQMAIALSLRGADSRKATVATPGLSRGNEEVTLEVLGRQSSANELVLHPEESQLPITCPNNSRTAGPLSDVGYKRTESGTSGLPNPAWNVDEVATTSAVPETRSPDQVEGEGADAIENNESRHFEAVEMSTERMKELRDELEIEAQEIKRQKTSQQGAAETVSDEMYAETRDLLKLFGIPYLEAPTEAEAQCAFLNLEHIADGVITEDSDAFLFGAKTVYRRLFSEGRFAEAYEATDIKNNLGLDRELLIRLAYLLGSDYTSGIRGVGVVNSMEILEAFPGERGLEEFREWTKKVTVFDEEPEDSIMKGTSQDAVRRRFCWKHRNMKRNWEIRDGFPSNAVGEAYRNPHVDTSTEKFKWGKVDFSGLARFCWEKFGWEQDRFNDAVGPLRKKLNEDSGLQQSTIDEFFKPHRFAKIRSERLQTAVRGIAGDDSKELMATVVPKTKKRSSVPIAHLPTVLSDEEDEVMMEALDKAERERGLRLARSPRRNTDGN